MRSASSTNNNLDDEEADLIIKTESNLSSPLNINSEHDTTEEKLNCEMKLKKVGMKNFSIIISPTYQQNQVNFVSSLSVVTIKKNNILIIAEIPVISYDQKNERLTARQPCMMRSPPMTSQN